MRITFSPVIYSRQPGAGEKELIASIPDGKLRALAEHLATLQARYRALAKQQYEIHKQVEEEVESYWKVRTELMHRRLQSEGLTVCEECVRVKRLSSCRLLYWEGAGVHLSGPSFNELEEVRVSIRGGGCLCRRCEAKLRKRFAKSKPTDDYWRKFHPARRRKKNGKCIWEYKKDAVWMPVPERTEIDFPPNIGLLEDFARGRRWAKSWIVPPRVEFER